MVRHFKHGGDTLEVIGTVTGAREDEYGLWIHAELSSDPVAQEARAKVAEGHVSGLSIGYIPISQRETVMDGEVVLELREIKLMEVTLTPFPANELAEVTAAKSAEEGRTQTVSTPGTVAEARPAPTDWRIAIARRRLALARALW
jgi:HK97 family phage prohead protease